MFQADQLISYANLIARLEPLQVFYKKPCNLTQVHLATEANILDCAAYCQGSHNWGVATHNAD